MAATTPSRPVLPVVSDAADHATPSQLRSINSNHQVAVQEDEQGRGDRAERLLLATRIWKKLGLDTGVLCTMVKGACAPTIAVALYQTDSFAQEFATLGYLVAIMSILSFPILPRAKFLQTMFLNVIGLCIGASIALLGVYSSVQARIYTSVYKSTASGNTPPEADIPIYNSSASAVSAIWLFLNILFANALRFSRSVVQARILAFSAEHI